MGMSMADDTLPVQLKGKGKCKENEKRGEEREASEVKGEKE